MAISSPVLAGGIYQRNRTSWTITTTQAVPAGAMLWLACVGDIADDAIVTVTDSANNNYRLQVNSQQPGTIGTLFLFLVPNCLALANGASVTFTSSQRGDLLAVLYSEIGPQGSLYSTDVEWSAGSAPSGTVPAKAGMGVLALLGVAGPNNDGFTQAPGWGPDLAANISTVNATIHGGFKLADVDGTYTYAPTLGANRQNLVLVASFK